MRSPFRGVIFESLHTDKSSDPLAFRLLTRNKTSESHNISKIVDVDYTSLMLKKRDVIRESPALLDLLTNVEDGPPDDPLLLRSDSYLAVGCDLRELDVLRRVLAREIDLSDSVLIFVAEVSITYMDVDAADAVIEWASRFEEGAWLIFVPLPWPVQSSQKP